MPSQPLTSALLQKIQHNDPSLVKKLFLCDQNLGDADVAKLAPALRHNSHIAELHLHKNKIGNQGASELAAALCQVSTLQTLGLSHNQICDQGATELADALCLNSALRVLWLENNKIGDRGATELAAALRQNSVLQTLYLAFNRISDRGASAILDALTYNDTLTHISLGSNNISETLIGKIEDLVEANQNGTRQKQVWRNQVPENANQSSVISYVSSWLFPRRNQEPAKMGTSHPCMWAISYEQLLGIREKSKAFFRDRNEDFATKTMHDINRDIVEPMCQEYSTSYALHLNPKGLKADTFVTHSWDEPFDDFVASIKSHFCTSIAKPNLWICTFALQQGDAQYTTQQLNVPLESSPFVLALQEAESFLVVRNSKTDVYQRLWCVCELFFAKQCGLVPRRAYVAGPNSFQHSKTTFAKATASDDRDHNRILTYLLTNDNADEIDGIIQTLRSHESNI